MATQRSSPNYWRRLAEDAEAKKRDASFFRRQQALAVVKQLKAEMRNERKQRRAS